MDDMNWLTVPGYLNVVGISGDGPYSHRKFIEENNLSYPLLSDTSEDVVDDYGVLNDEQDGVKDIPQRSLFLIGPDQRVKYRWIADDNWGRWNTSPLEGMREHIGTIKEML